MIRVAAVLVALGAPATAETVPEPRDYRMERYRAPVPHQITGGTTIGAAEAHALWQAGRAVFVDVLPAPPKPADLPEGTIWRDKPHATIPGAIWLPNVGYGKIADVTADYFRQGLARATGGDPTQPVVIFCLADCWMSWNAARRAIEWGYDDVYWFPDGVDGWTFEGFPVEQVAPEPGFDQSS